MQDVTLTWKGTEYRVEARDVLPLIAKVEEVLTLTEIIDAAQRGTVQLAKLSMAYGVALRHAGARVTNDEVYSGMFAADARKAATDAATALLSLMVPPEHLQEKGDGKKKVEGTLKGSSSRKRTKRQSHTESLPENSGE